MTRRGMPACRLRPHNQKRVSTPSPLAGSATMRPWQAAYACHVSSLRLAVIWILWPPTRRVGPSRPHAIFPLTPPRRRGRAMPMRPRARKTFSSPPYTKRTSGRPSPRLLFLDNAKTSWHGRATPAIGLSTSPFSQILKAGAAFLSTRPKRVESRNIFSARRDVLPVSSPTS